MLAKPGSSLYTLYCVIILRQSRESSFEGEAQDTVSPYVFKAKLTKYRLEERWKFEIHFIRTCPIQNIVLYVHMRAGCANVATAAQS